MTSEGRPSLLAPFLDPVEADTPAPAKFQPFLTFHLRTHIEFSVRYEQLLWIIFKPGDEIVLRYSNHSVRLYGLRLRQLCEAIRTVSVHDVYEQDDRFDLEENKTEPIIARVTIGPIADADGLLTELTQKTP